MESGTRPVKGIRKMVAGMTPILQDGTFVFCSVIHSDDTPKAMAVARGMFVEDEGLSLILPKLEAEQLNLAFGDPMKQITLMVYSSASGVGLTAAVARELAREKIPANIVSATQHDHIFVPSQQANDTMDVLRALQSRAQLEISEDAE